MDALLSLWIPILASAGIAFFISMIAWTVMPHHKGDIQRLDKQDEIMSAVASAGVKPGYYMYPQPETPAGYKEQAFKDVYDKGPWGALCVFPGKANMPMNLLGTFSIILSISAFVGYLSSLAFAANPAPGFMEVFQFAGTAAVLGHCFGGMCNDVWFKKPVRFVVTDFLDKLVFGLATGAVFAWLWPAAEAATPAIPGG